MISDPVDYKPKYQIDPILLDGVLEAGHARQIIYDIWREAVECVEAGRSIPTERPYLAAYPAVWQVSLGTAHRIRTYETIPDIRAFVFFTIVPRLAGMKHARSIYAETEARSVAADVIVLCALFAILR